jgi:hypothetical protein
VLPAPRGQGNEARMTKQRFCIVIGGFLEPTIPLGDTNARRHFSRPSLFSLTYRAARLHNRRDDPRPP